MDLSSFCNKTRPNMLDAGNIGFFIGALFAAAGSKTKTVPPRPNYGTDSYHKLLFSGQKPFSKPLKQSFPVPINFDGLSAFFNKFLVGNDSLRSVMTAFGLSADTEADKDCFVAALCRQFQAIVSADSKHEAADIVQSEYAKLLTEPRTVAADNSPLYPGDNFQVIKETPAHSHSVYFYDKFNHSWTIRNNGKVAWGGRTLVYINRVTPTGRNWVRANPESINIPDLPPGGEVTITAHLDGYQHYGSFELVWEIRNSDGLPCFKDKDKQLTVQVNVLGERPQGDENE